MYGNVRSMEGATVQDWLLRVSGTWSQRDFTAIVVICWNLWFARNRRVWEEEVHASRDVVERSRRYVEQYWAVLLRKKPAAGVKRARTSEIWYPPAEGHLKVNIDGAVFAEEHCTGVGVVIRNSTGQVLYARSCMLLGRAPALHAELRAICFALQWVYEMGLQNVCIETDSRVAVELLEGKLVRVDEAGILVHSCQHWLYRIPSATLQHTKRGGNAVAHALARGARMVREDRSWIGETPEHVGELVTADYRS